MQRTGSSRILLAEDVTMVRNLIREILASEGYDVVCAENGARAIEKYKQQTFDLVIMDIHMPCLDGFEVARIIRDFHGANGKPPILALTASLTLSDLKTYQFSYFDDIVRKPFRRDVLVDTVAIWLNGIGSDFFEKKPSGLQDIIVSDLDFFHENISMVGFELSKRWIEELECCLESCLNAPLFDLEALRRSVHNVVALAGALGFFKLASHCACLEEKLLQCDVFPEKLYARAEARKLRASLAAIKIELQQAFPHESAMGRG